MGVSASLERSLFERGQTFTDGIFGKLSYAVDVELFHNLATVRLDGLGAYMQFQGNLLHSLTFGQELEHLALPVCEGFCFKSAVVGKCST